MRTLTSTEVARLLGVPTPTVQAWVRRGIIRPVVRTPGTGNHSRYSITDVVAIAVGRGLRERGISLKAAGAVLGVLRGLSEDELLRQFAQGNTCVVLCGDRALGRLLSRDDVFIRTGEPQFDAILPIGVDVEVIYDQICQKIGAGSRRGDEVPAN